MNAGVSSEKEKVKESQSQTVTKGDTPARHPLSGAGLGASHSMNSDRRNSVDPRETSLASPFLSIFLATISHFQQKKCSFLPKNLISPYP